MNTAPIVPENVASRMPAQPACAALAAMSAHKPSTTEQLPVRGLTYTVRRWGPADAPQVFLLHGWMDSSPTFQFVRSEEHTSELQSRENLVCRLLLEKKKTTSANVIGMTGRGR